MGKAKLIIGVVVLVVIIAAVAIAIGGGSSDDKDGADITYDWTGEFRDEIPIGEGLSLRPAEGMTYLVVEYVMANHTDSAISTNYIMAQLSATLGDGISYPNSTSAATSAGYQMIDIAPGAQGGTVAVFEVPEGHQVSDFTVTLDYVDFGDPTVEFDDNLL